MEERAHAPMQTSDPINCQVWPHPPAKGDHLARVGRLVERELTLQVPRHHCLAYLFTALPNPIQVPASCSLCISPNDASHAGPVETPALEAEARPEASDAMRSLRVFPETGSGVPEVTGKTGRGWRTS